MEMKRIACMMIAMLLAYCAASQSAVTLAREGDSSYREGDYAGAIECYETALATGRGAAEVYYNLGNAYYRDNQIGRAILNYERALRLRPGMKDARANLELANEHTVDRIAELPQWFVVRWWNALTNNVLPSTWRVVWLLALLLLAAAVVGLFVGRGTGLRRWCIAVGLFGVLFLATVSILLVKTTVNYNAHRAAIVMQDAVAVKSSPEQRSADLLILHEGTRVVISESLQGWERITIADGTTGWCTTDAVERV